MSEWNGNRIKTVCTSFCVTFIVWNANEKQNRTHTVRIYRAPSEKRKICKAVASEREKDVYKYN